MSETSVFFCFFSLTTGDFSDIIYWDFSKLYKYIIIFYICKAYFTTFFEKLKKYIKE